MKRIKLNRDRVVSVLFLLFVIGFIFSFWHNSDGKKNSELIKTKTSAGIKLSNLIPDIREITEAFSDKNLQKGDYVNPWGALQRLVGNRYITSPDNRNVVRLKNGYLVWDDFFANDVRVERYEKWTDGMRLLKLYLDEQNIPLLYVQNPNKIDTDTEQYPMGFDNNVNRFQDSVLSYLRELGADTLDLRQEFAAAGLDHYGLFFKTDHHWTPEAALQGARIICEKLNRDYGYGIDLSLLTDENMKRVTYEDIFLGSQGKRAGVWFSCVDDLTVITPTYPTDFTCSFKTVSEKTFERNGDFDKAFMFYDRVSTVNYFAKNPYTVYTGSDYAETCYVNNRIKNHRILLVRDSFCCTLAPFLSLAACNELYTVDPRHDKQILSERIDEIKPDIVVFVNYVDFTKMAFFPN